MLTRLPMKRASWVVLVVLSGCEPEVTDTFVTGSVRDVSLPAAAAISRADKDLLGTKRQTIWLSSTRPVCGHVVTDSLEVSHVELDGGRMPALMLQNNGAALFDTGRGEERLRGTSEMNNVRTDDTGTISGRFTATFVGETISGDFVAPPCGAASPGCSGAPALLGAAGVLVLFGRRGRRRPLHR